MTTTKEMIELILSHEGGYVDHPADKGGATNYGITQTTLSKYLGRSVTKDEVRNLDRRLAFEIYEKNYLTAPRIDTLPDEVKCQVFDISVNSGPRTAIKLVQRVINRAGFGPIDEDGVCGPNTRDRAFLAQDGMGKYFNNAIADERSIFFKKIVANNPSQEVFLKGWLKRAESFKC